jgi:hypothetical protein
VSVTAANLLKASNGRDRKTILLLQVWENQAELRIARDFLVGQLSDIGLVLEIAKYWPARLALCHFSGYNRKVGRRRGGEGGGGQKVAVSILAVQCRECGCTYTKRKGRALICAFAWFLISGHSTVLRDHCPAANVASLYPAIILAVAFSNARATDRLCERQHGFRTCPFCGR